VERLRLRFPAVALHLVVDATPHGANRKVANLMNMLHAVPSAGPEEVVVVSDSDIHAAPDWLRQVVSALAAPGVGLATTLYVGLAARGFWVERLGCAWITHTFLPGVLLARGMGRQDCLGATMALRAGTLAEIGGLDALANHLADDNELGRLVRARGLAVALAGSVPATTVAEARLADLWRHELRWGRTIRALVPGAFAASAVQYPVFWALAAFAASGGAAWAAWGVVLAWAVRALAARGVDKALGHAGTRVPALWLPVRDVLSVAVVAAAFLGRRVVWRGQVLRA
jgi:ceramide glucosyltransferase